MCECVCGDERMRVRVCVCVKESVCVVSVSTRLCVHLAGLPLAPTATLTKAPTTTPGPSSWEVLTAEEAVRWCVPCMDA